MVFREPFAFGKNKRKQILFSSGYNLLFISQMECPKLIIPQCGEFFVCISSLFSQNDFRLDSSTFQILLDP